MWVGYLVVGHLPQLPLTSMYVMAILDLLVDFPEVLCRWKSTVVLVRQYRFSHSTLQHAMLMITCGFIPYFLFYGFYIDEFKFTPPNRQSFFSANISGCTVCHQDTCKHINSLILGNINKNTFWTLFLQGYNLYINITKQQHKSVYSFSFKRRFLKPVHVSKL